MNPGTPAAPQRHGRVVAAAAVGNAFEWYDFSVFVLFAPLIAAAFFPEDSPTGGLVKALLAFGVGFVARPLGAVRVPPLRHREILHEDLESPFPGERNPIYEFTT
jgi:hypothetical protein